MSLAASTAKPVRDESRDGVVTVGLVVLSQVAHFLTYAAIPLFLPLIRQDLGISFTQAGALSAAGLLSYALAQIPAGYLSDRVGPRRLFFAGLLGWSTLCVGFSLAGAYGMALAILLVAGFFRALLFAPGLSLLASWFPPQRRATAMSLLLLGATTGSVVLALAGPGLAALHGWRVAFVAFALIGIAVACLFGALASDPPKAAAREPLALHDALRIARIPVLWVCNGLQAVRFAVSMGFGFWLPSFLIADRGLSVAAAGAMMAASAAIAAPSYTLGAYVSDRLKNPPLVIGGALAALAAAALALPAAESMWQLFLVVAAYSVFQGFYFGPLFLVPVEVLGLRYAGVVTGFGNLFANLGGFVSVYALGVIRDGTGSFRWGFTAISATCVVGVLLAMLLSRLRSRALVA